MKLVKIQRISKHQTQTYDITVSKNHNFFANGHLIHNCGYTGELKVIIINHGKDPYPIKKGDRIAQLVVVPFLSCETVLEKDFDKFNTERGKDGFGSSGK